MPKDRVFLLVIGAVALAGLVCLLGAAVYLSQPASWVSALAAPATPTQALNLAALPTSLIPTLPPEWTAAPFPTRAAPTASQPALAPLNASVPASPLPSATLAAVDAGPPTNAPAASPIAPSSDPASSTSPAATASSPGAPSPTAPSAATAGPPGAPSPTTPPATTAPQPTGTPQPSPTNVPGAGGIGQRIEAGGIGLTVMGVSKQGDSSSVYLVVDVVLENVSREQAAYEYIHFIVVDSDGLLYYAADAPEPSLQEGDLARGSQVRGNVAFYVEPETHGLILYYDPGLLSSDVERIQVNLGQ